MVRPLLVKQQVGRGRAELALRDLLEIALIVDAAVAFDGGVDLPFEVSEDELLRGRHAAVEVDRADQALEHVGEDGRGGFVMRAHPLAHHEKLVEPE